ncbi:hypothetical protein NA57DRAFT_57603 [Rhizodiscina lignyota]|uniref:Zn(2)-C6 fungal-type domain-containing protein n=1 Tax=Rhizodiscina lignyota TaxID=1504668 RepID=A0A9P4IBI2_9PEZI|nr:hypothetical protein NA57DRAFT_57603 [Rhizodiscina lignyota]
MTQLFKCDTCRARKVKCDEARPQCGECRKRARTCTYRTRDPSVLVLDRTSATKTRSSTPRAGASARVSPPQETSIPLRFRNLRPTEEGDGVFQVFAPDRWSVRASKNGKTREEPSIDARERNLCPAPTRSLSSPENRLLSRWAAVMGSNPAYSHPLQAFGHWMALVPARIGTDVTLDLAVQYLIDSSEAYRLTRQINGNPARSTGEKALKSLQSAISSNRTDHSIALAIKMHFVAEVFMGLGTYYYVLHVTGMARMLQNRVSHRCEDKVDCVLIEASYFEEATESLLNGRDCVYDNGILARAMQDSSITATDFDTVSVMLAEQFVKIPRLARLVRESSARPDDVETFSQAVALANELYLDDLEPLMNKVLSDTSIVPTSAYKVATYFSESFHFSSIDLYTLATRYYTYRTLLFGLLQTLYGSGNPSAHFYIDKIEGQDIQAATALAMCVDYAMNVDLSFPLASLRVVAPIQMAFGTWLRLEKRARNAADAQRGRQMQEWSLELANGLLRDWKAPPDPLWMIRVKNEAFAGVRW